MLVLGVLYALTDGMAPGSSRGIVSARVIQIGGG